MATTDSYGQNIGIAALTDAPSAFALAFALADGLTPQTVMRFASATARNATLTAPVAGMTAYLTTEQILTVYTGSAWVAIATTPGAWTSFTPTWTGATTNPVVGNGTLLGYYSLNGKTCHFHIDLVTGSTTTFGSGNWSFALPFPAVNGHGSRVGTAQTLGTGVGRYAGQCVISPGASTTSAFFPDPNGDATLFFAKSDTPYTWTTSEQMRISATYETA